MVYMAIIKEIKIKEDFITLGQFLKVIDLISSGGEAKIFLINNKITVNSELENRRGKKLYINDEIEINGDLYKIC